MIRTTTLSLPALALAAALAGAQTPSDSARMPDSAVAVSTVASNTESAPAKPRFSGPAIQLRADLSARELYVVENGEVVATYPVAIGSPNHPTPKGTYSIRKIVWNPTWVPPDEKWARGKTPKPAGHPANPMKTVKIFFHEPDYYIHGTGDVDSMGEAASHGCLRMVPSQAAEVARWVMEHGGQPKEESWFKRVLHFRSQTKTVYLQSPVQMTVSS